MNDRYTPPEVRVIPNARIQAFTPPIVAAPPAGFRGGVVLGDSDGDRKLRHSRYWSAVDTFDDRLDFSERLHGEFVYLGPLYDHFGHTMAEFVHRAIPSLILSSVRNFLVVGTHNNQPRDTATMPNFFKGILQYLNISPERIKIVSSHSTVDSLFMCEQGSDFGGGSKDGYLPYLDFFTSMTPRPVSQTPNRSRRTYVSRAKVASGGNILGQGYIESAFVEEGYDVVYPEELSFIDQMDVYGTSEVLIFPEGSACHGIEFFGTHALENCHILERRPNHREIYKNVFRGRSKNFSSLMDPVPIGSIVLHSDRYEPISHLGVVLIDYRRLINYVVSMKIAKFENF